MKTMKFAACAAMALAAVANGQTTPTSAEYEMRFVPAVSSGLPPGANVQYGPPSAISINFVIQARARTPAGTTNYGINRWSTGSITTSAATHTVMRASSSSAAAFGRFRSAANGNAQNFARFSAAAGTGGTSATGVDANNVNGTVAGNSITGIDAYRGFAWTPITAPLDPDTGEPIFGPGDPAANPWGGTNTGAIGGPITDGSWGAWQSLYAFNHTAGDFNSVLITVSGSLNIARSITFVAGSWTFDQLPNVTPVTITYGWSIPTPSAAALLGLGGLAAARRRR